MGVNNVNRCLMCDSPIRNGLDTMFCSSVCHCKSNKIVYGTEAYELWRKAYADKNEMLDKENETYNQALLDAGNLYVDHPEKVAHVEVKGGTVELKDVEPLMTIQDETVYLADDFEAREEAKELKLEHVLFNSGINIYNNQWWKGNVMNGKPKDKGAYVMNHPLLSLILSAQNGDRGQAQKYIAEIGLDVIALLIRKNTDYGSSVFNAPLLRPSLDPLVAIDVRMSDKIKRIANLLENPENTQVAEESVDTTLDDLCGYIILRKVVKMLSKDNEDMRKSNEA